MHVKDESVSCCRDLFLNLFLFIYFFQFIPPELTAVKDTNTAAAL